MQEHPTDVRYVEGSIADDLLEACKVARKVVERTRGAHDAMAKCEAAIARAEGKA